MPNLNGIEAARQISAKEPRHRDRRAQHACRRIVRAARPEGRGPRLRAEGARGSRISFSAIRLGIDGKSFFSPAVSRMLVEDYVRQLQDKDIEDSYELLTSREREILQLVAEGKSNKDIANMLNLSLYTVETHRSNILEKLNLHSVPELIFTRFERASSAEQFTPAAGRDSGFAMRARRVLPPQEPVPVRSESAKYRIRRRAPVRPTGYGRSGARLDITQGRDTDLESTRTLRLHSGSGRRQS